jgi:hypothetical protein
MIDPSGQLLVVHSILPPKFESGKMAFDEGIKDRGVTCEHRVK